VSAILSEEWLESVATEVETSAFADVAEGFESTVVFGTDDRDVAVTFEDGEMTVLGAATYETWDFALRARTETWEKLTAETPPPLHHDLIGAWLQSDLTIEGDLRMAIRHLRPLKRLLDQFAAAEATA
jgi:hypothetical protein